MRVFAVPVVCSIDLDVVVQELDDHVVQLVGARYAARSVGAAFAVARRAATLADPALAREDAAVDAVVSPVAVTPVAAQRLADAVDGLGDVLRGAYARRSRGRSAPSACAAP